MQELMFPPCASVKGYIFVVNNLRCGQWANQGCVFMHSHATVSWLKGHFYIYDNANVALRSWTEQRSFWSWYSQHEGLSLHCYQVCLPWKMERLVQYGRVCGELVEAVHAATMYMHPLECSCSANTPYYNTVHLIYEHLAHMWRSNGSRSKGLSFYPDHSRSYVSSSLSQWAVTGSFSDAVFSSPSNSCQCWGGIVLICEMKCVWGNKKIKCKMSDCYAWDVTLYTLWRWLPLYPVHMHWLQWRCKE